MGDINIPEKVATIYHDVLGGWMTEREWIERFNIKYQDSKYIKFYKESPDIHFVAFFTTGTEDHPNSWRHIMMVAAMVKYIRGIPGSYIEVRHLSRYGIVNDDVKEYSHIAKLYSDDDEIKLIKLYEIPTTFLGDIKNYPHMLGSLSSKMKGVKL